jgi:hypothetical protein
VQAARLGAHVIAMPHPRGAHVGTPARRRANQTPGISAPRVVYSAEHEEAGRAMKRTCASLRRARAAGMAAAVLLAWAALSQRALAFGGLWAGGGAHVAQSGEDVLFVDNPDATITAVVQIRYAGAAARFAWLIPVPGKPRVEVASSTVFARLEAATAPQYWVEVGVDGTCKGADDGGALDAGAAYGASDDLDTSQGPVVVVDAGKVGPYDYVTIDTGAAGGEPAEAATAWLAQNGYDLTGLEHDALDPYLRDGLNLLAFKLSDGADTGAIRPVALTYAGELPRIPIRPAAVAAQDDMRLRVWVAGATQAVPQNYRSLVLNEAMIDWLSGARFAEGTLPSGGAGIGAGYLDASSNYAQVVSAAADEAGGRGFVTELAAPASRFRDQVWSAIDDDNVETIAGATYADGIDAILAASRHYRGWDGWDDAVRGATALPEHVSLAEFGEDPERYRGAAVVDTQAFLTRLRRDVVEPVAAAGAMLQRAPYLTRLYTTLSAGEMTRDPVFAYNADLAQVSNVHVAAQRIACSDARAFDEAPWRMVLPQGGVVAGQGDDGWPFSAGAMPANLVVVALGEHGAGYVVEDNSAAIGELLFATAGARDGDPTLLSAPQNGLLIGGTQRVTAHARAAAPPDATLRVSGGGCGVAGPRTSAAPAWLLAATLVVCRRRRRRSRRRALTGAAAILLLSAASLTACDDGNGNENATNDAAAAAAKPDAGPALASGTLSREQLLDPETCKGCHPIHYREWSSSMHAYAAQDPVFLAMNRRGQRETNGALGDFCIKCHAPMAAIDKLTSDGLDLESLPDRDRGVSCYFCHNVAGIEGDHNAMLRLANDTTMRGPIEDPLQPGAHRAQYSSLFDRTRESTQMCGGCHDIVTPNGVHLERTFQEYKRGVFAKSATGEAMPFETCIGCHMPSRQSPAASVPGAPTRLIHEHLWPGVDVPLTDFPNRDALRSAVEDCQLGVASLSFFTLEVTAPDLFTFQLETNAGHNQPSGAAQDRRMWLEFMAYGEDGKRLDAHTSGDIADGELEEKPPDDPRHDPNLAMFRDRIYDARGEPVHMFWEAAKSDAYPDGYVSHALPSATTTYVEGRHAVVKQYRAAGPNGELPARVTARLRMRPIGMDVLQDLVDSGDLDPAIAARMPTFTFGALVEWRDDGSAERAPVPATLSSDCGTYRCLLDPGSQFCK